MTWRRQGLYQPKVFTMASGHNRLIKMTQGSDSLQYVYDDDGNRAKDDDFDPSGYARRAYFYDALGRTNGIVNMGTDANGSYLMGGVNQCWYDALGRQIKACGYGVPFLTLDGQSIVRAENWRIRHGPGLDDPLIALARNDSYNEGVNPKEVYYLTDGAGRHYAVADTNGSIAAEIWNETASVYLGFRATGAVTQSHSFGEERLSTERTPGLSYFRNRVYDQETGRWTQEDPIGIAGGINLYQFNGNDPATYGDPYGLCPPRDESPCTLGDVLSLRVSAGAQVGASLSVGLVGVDARAQGWKVATIELSAKYPAELTMSDAELSGEFGLELLGQRGGLKLDLLDDAPGVVGTGKLASADVGHQRVERDRSGRATRLGVQVGIGFEIGVNWSAIANLAKQGKEWLQAKLSE